MTESAHVSFLEGESARQLVLKGEVVRFRVWRLEAVIHAPVDAEAVSRWGVGERLCGRKRRQEYVRDGIGRREARRILEAQHVGRVGDSGTDAKGAFLIKGVHKRFAIVVVIQAGTGADRGAGVWCPNYPNAWCDVIFLLGPVAGSVICLAGRGKGKRLLIDLALLRSRFALFVPGICVDGGRNLLPVGFVRCLQNGVAKTEGDGQVGPGMPAVLQEVLELVGMEILLDKGALRKCGRSRGAGDSVIV